jgi:hypothetical protein
MTARSKPPAVDDPDRYIIDPPPAISDRAQWLHARILSGAWTPRRSLIWAEGNRWSVHQELGVYRWEWGGLLLPAACTRYADSGLAKVVELPGCPTAQPLPWWSRWEDDVLRAVCMCPDEPERRHMARKHWLNWVDRRLLYCQCGPQDCGVGAYSEGNQDGYVCRDCSRGLPDRSLSRYLVCDMPCCYCGQVAKGGRTPWEAGYRLSGHPALAV